MEVCRTARPEAIEQWKGGFGERKQEELDSECVNSNWRSDCLSKSIEQVVAVVGPQTGLFASQPCVRAKHGCENVRFAA